MSLIIWLTGLPGSGKSTIAQALLRSIGQSRLEYLSLDTIRKEIIPHPEYTDAERDLVYEAYADRALLIASSGKDVLLDATGHKKRYRDRLRAGTIPFIEIFISCPLAICMEREAARTNNLVISNTYKRALAGEKKRRDGLGEVIGIDVPYEENHQADLIIDSASLTPELAARTILNFLETKGFK